MDLDKHNKFASIDGLNGCLQWLSVAASINSMTHRSLGVVFEKGNLAKEAAGTQKTDLETPNLLH